MRQSPNQTGQAGKTKEFPRVTGSNRALRAQERVFGRIDNLNDALKKIKHHNISNVLPELN